MKAWIDSDNIIHMGGRPRFVIGLYDTTGFALRPDFYAPRLKAIAKAPINLMINYFLGNGRADIIYPYTEAMEPFGIFYLATVNALFPERPPVSKWARVGNIGPDQVIAQYAKHWPVIRTSSATTLATNARAKFNPDIPPVRADQRE